MKRAMRAGVALAFALALLAALAIGLVGCVAVPEPPAMMQSRGLNNPLDVGTLTADVRTTGGIYGASVTSSGGITGTTLNLNAGGLAWGDVSKSGSSWGDLATLSTSKPVTATQVTISGTLQTGGTANHANFEADGTLALTGEATGWEDLRIDGLSTRNGVVAPTDEVGFRGSASFYSRNLVHNQADEVQFSVQMPHSWKVESAVWPHVHISPWITNTGTVTVSLVFDCYDASIGSAFPSSSKLYTVTTSWNGDAQWKHLLAGGVSSYSMSGMTLSSVQKCRLYRDNGVAGNLAGKIALLYIDWHYEVDTPAGSRGTLAK